MILYLTMPGAYGAGHMYAQPLSITRFVITPSITTQQNVCSPCFKLFFHTANRIDWTFCFCLCSILYLLLIIFLRMKLRPFFFFAVSAKKKSFWGGTDLRHRLHRWRHGARTHEVPVCLLMTHGPAPVCVPPLPSPRPVQRRGRTEGGQRSLPKRPRSLAPG